MEFIYYWLIGWIILSLGHYLYNVKDKTITKKLHAWRAFWVGIFSWVGIWFCISLYIVYIICKVNDWIENKLNS